jgi:hypothetical protein
MLHFKTVNKAATTIYDFDTTTLWVSRVKGSKIACRSAAEPGGLFWVFVCDFAWCACKGGGRADLAGTNNKGRRMRRGEMGRMCDGGFGVFGLWEWFGAAVAPDCARLLTRWFSGAGCWKETRSAPSPTGLFLD